MSEQQSNAHLLKRINTSEYSEIALNFLKNLPKEEFTEQAGGGLRWPRPPEPKILPAKDDETNERVNLIIQLAGNSGNAEDVGEEEEKIGINKALEEFNELMAYHPKFKKIKEFFSPRKIEGVDGVHKVFDHFLDLQKRMILKTGELVQESVPWQLGHRAGDKRPKEFHVPFKGEAFLPYGEKWLAEEENRIKLREFIGLVKVFLKLGEYLEVMKDWHSQPEFRLT